MKTLGKTLFLLSALALFGAGIAAAEAKKEEPKKKATQAEIEATLKYNVYEKIVNVIIKPQLGLFGIPVAGNYWVSCGGSGHAQTCNYKPGVEPKKRGLFSDRETLGPTGSTFLGMKLKCGAVAKSSGGEGGCLYDSNCAAYKEPIQMRCLIVEKKKDKP